MKNSLFIIALGLFLSVNVSGQTKVVSKSNRSAFVTKASELNPNLDITIGYIPKSTSNALKASFSANNILLERVGAYASLEIGLDSDYFASILGVTATINKYVYLWSGIGLFPKHEKFNDMTWNSFRKEAGIGFTPYKMTVIRIGYSVGIGPTISAGIKIPIPFEKG